MTNSELANLVTIVGLPLLLLQLLVADRARTANELVELLAAVQEQEVNMLQEADLAAKELKFYALLNTFESYARLLNGWLISIWSRHLWFTYLLSTVERYCSQAPYDAWVHSRSAEPAAFAGLKNFFA